MAHAERASRMHASTTWRVPRPWQRVLLEGHPLPRGAGLYTPRVGRGRFNRGILAAKIVGHQWRPGPSGSFLLGKNGMTVLGISMCIYGHDLDLLMFPPSEALSIGTACECTGCGVRQGAFPTFIWDGTKPHRRSGAKLRRSTTKNPVTICWGRMPGYEASRIARGSSTAI